MRKVKQKMEKTAFGYVMTKKGLHTRVMFCKRRRKKQP